MGSDHQKPKVFVIMPFQDCFFEVYEGIRNEFQDYYEFSNAAVEDNQQNILSDIFAPIIEADIIIADLTQLNPNVLYELGVAHAFKKKTIIITQDDLITLPFDLKQYRTKRYGLHFKMFSELLNYLDKNIAGAIDGTVTYGNPVLDTLERFPQITVEKSCSQHMASSIQQMDDEDKGFIDFLTEIETDLNDMNTHITVLTSSLEEMSTGINKSAEDMSQVSGNGKAAFIHKETRKISAIIATFQQQLRLHNNANIDLWNKIETNTLGLLENEFIQYIEDKKGLVQYIRALVKMKQATTIARQNFNVVLENIQRLRNIERSLTQTVKSIEIDFQSFSDWTIQVGAGVDRIVRKSKCVIGEIN